MNLIGLLFAFMLNPSTPVQSVCIHFLQQSTSQRLVLLKQLGLARYADFLTKMPFNEANVACVMRFFDQPKLVKFPQLQAADLSELNLDGVNFIRGNLSAANLKGSSLVNADLLFANLTNANLINANLTDATLNETIWLGTLVNGCSFGAGIGLTPTQRRDLRLRGAKFDLHVIEL